MSGKPGRHGKSHADTVAQSLGRSMHGMYDADIVAQSRGRSMERRRGGKRGSKGSGPRPQFVPWPDNLSNSSGSGSNSADRYQRSEDSGNSKASWATWDAWEDGPLPSEPVGAVGTEIPSTDGHKGGSGYSNHPVAKGLSFRVKRDNEDDDSDWEGSSVRQDSPHMFSGCARSPSAKGTSARQGSPHTFSGFAPSNFRKGSSARKDSPRMFNGSAGSLSGKGSSSHQDSPHMFSGFADSPSWCSQIPSGSNGGEERQGSTQRRAENDPDDANHGRKKKHPNRNRPSKDVRDKQRQEQHAQSSTQLSL